MIHEREMINKNEIKKNKKKINIEYNENLTNTKTPKAVNEKAAHNVAAKIIDESLREAVQANILDKTENLLKVF